MRYFAAALFGLTFCGSVSCAPFQNGSFELGGSPGKNLNIPAGSTVITGWTVSVGNIDWEGAPVPACGWQASNGNNSLDLVGTGGIGGIQQTFDSVPGTTYQVSFDMAGKYGPPPASTPSAGAMHGVWSCLQFDST